MLTAQQLVEIAWPHPTAMADAMLLACLRWSVRNGRPLDLPRDRPRPPRRRGGRRAPEARPGEHVPWRRMVEGNSDSRIQHV